MSKPGKLVVTVAIVLFAGLLGSIGATPVFARSLEYSEYVVDINVDKDSTFTVRETQKIIFNGEYEGVIRGITLSNPGRDSRCYLENLRCGGFEFLGLVGVYNEDGSPVDPKRYEVGIIEDEDTGKRYYQIKYYVWPGGKFHTNEEFTWSFEYKLFGGLDFDNEYGYLYWNAIPEDLAGPIEEAEVNINLPAGTSARESDLSVYTLNDQIFNFTTLGNRVKLQGKGLDFYTGAVTVEYRISKQYVDEHGTLNFSQTFPFKSPDITVDDTVLSSVSGPLKGLPTGSYEIEFSLSGYEPQTLEVDVRDGEVVEYTYSLSPKPLTVIIIAISLLLNCVGLVLVPFGVFWVYRSWSQKGRDEHMPKTIIPIYQPPAGARPYLLGSIKDERVDREDITSSIIDLAFRGYIKIKELKKGSNYLLTKTDKSKEDLDDIESYLMDSIFGNGKEKETKNLKNKFYTKYQLLVKKVARKMVSDGLFKRLPETVRGEYYAWGIFFLSVGTILTVFSIVLFLEWIGFFGPIALGLAMVSTGIAYLFAAPHMPAKTAKGSKLFAETLGFKMYMDFTERYRVQNLEPEEFEKYLSYAVAFGIEKQWAKKFADIYKGQPDWYESDRIDAWDVYLISSFTRDFATNLNSVVYTPVQTNSGATGSGWSGGGSFGGGFSGGGGGGGFSGGF